MPPCVEVRKKTRLLNGFGRHDFVALPHGTAALAGLRDLERSPGDYMQGGRADRGVLLQQVRRQLRARGCRICPRGLQVQAQRAQVVVQRVQLEPGRVACTTGLYIRHFSLASRVCLCGLRVQAQYSQVVVQRVQLEPSRVARTAGVQPPGLTLDPG